MIIEVGAHLGRETNRGETMSLRERLITVIGTVAAAAMIVAPSAGADTPGHYVVTDLATDSVYSFTPAGARTTITIGGNLANPEGIVRLSSNDYLLADKGPLGGPAVDGRVVRVTAGVQSLVASANLLIEPHAIALSADRKTAFTGSRNGAIVAVTIATGAQRLVAPAGGNLTDVRGIAVEGSGNLLVVNSGAAANTPRLLRVDPNTGAQTALLTGPPLTDPRAILVRPNGDVVIGDQGDPGDGFILGVYFLPSIYTHIFSAGAFWADNSVPGALALDTTGRIVGADRNTGGGNTNGRLFAVKPGGVASDIVPAAGGLLSEPSGLAIVPPKCGSKFATIVGTPGRDTLLGTNGPDVIAAIGGADTVKGKGGKDLICGGKGKDILSGGGGRDTLIGGKGRDRSTGGPGVDTLKCTITDPRCVA